MKILGTILAVVHVMWHILLFWLVGQSVDTHYGEAIVIIGIVLFVIYKMYKKYKVEIVDEG